MGRALWSMQLPFGATVASLAAVAASFEAEAQLRRRIERITAERDHLRSRLREMGVWSADTHANFVYLPAKGQLWSEAFDGTGPRVRIYPDGGARITVGNRRSTQAVLATIAAMCRGCVMTPSLSTPSSPRFRLMHKIGAWYDAEAYFRRRAKSGRAFTMPIPGFGDVLFAAKPAHIREFLKIPVSAFTPPMPNPIEPVVGDGSIILLDGVRHKQERARFLPALHHDRIRRYTGLMVEAALDEIAKWQPGTTIDTRDAAQSITLQIIVQAVFGIDDRNATRPLRHRRQGDDARLRRPVHVLPRVASRAVRAGAVATLLGAVASSWMSCCRNRFRTADTPAPTASMTC